jgi:hypothetical protein
MRQNFQTKVRTGRNSPWGSKDIAIEKPGARRRSVRYDFTVVSRDYGRGAVIRTRQMGTQFRLLPNANAQVAAVSDAVLAERAGNAAMVAWATGQSAYVGGQRYGSFAAYRAAQQGNAPQGALLTVTRAHPDLVAELGFTPTVAVRV